MKRLFLILIVSTAAVLRLYALPHIPPGVNRDEASIGYTAYSLLKTGRDEYGRLLPLSFESFGDWKLPLYIYAAVPFVGVFGLTELAVRLPSAFAGTATVYFTYLLALELFASVPVALAAAAGLAFMPWHIHISRVESEAIVAVLMMTAGSYYFLTAIRKKSPGRLLTGAVLLALTYYTYHGNHVTTTLFSVGAFAVFRPGLVRTPGWRRAAAVFGVLTAAILSVTLLGADRTKLSGISIFGDPYVIHERIELPRTEHVSGAASALTRLVHNRFTYAVQTTFVNYLTSYGPEFLFVSGGINNAHNIRGFGNLIPLDAPFLLFGIAALISGLRRKEYAFVLWWIAIGAVAASITKDAPHSNRMLAVTPAFALCFALGLRYVWRQIPRITRKPLIAGLLLAYALWFFTYVDRYYVHFPRTEAGNWGTAYKNLSVVLQKPGLSGLPVIMSRPETFPYAYLLFYGAYPPDRYQAEATRYPVSADGFTDVSGYGRFSFRPIDWDTDTVSGTVIVARAEEVPDSARQYLVEGIRLPDGTPYFSVLHIP